MLKRVDHIGIIVDDIDAAKRFLGQALNLKLQREIDRPERAFKAAFFGCGDLDLEVIEVTEPEARRRRLGNNEARLEHIAIEVDDLFETLKTLEGIGVRTATAATRTTAGISAFTEPATTDGVMYQLIQKL
jgi:methylmalonyl-CoA/ethylmalonyl-CoA epimerase